VVRLLLLWRFTIAAIAAVVLGENMAKLCGLMLILCGVMSALHDR
jgi:hypothetical protein